MTFSWNYEQGWADISMSNYVRKTLHEFQHPPPPNPVYTPHKYKAPIYGSKIQYTKREDDSPILPPKIITHNQRVVSKFLYNLMAISNTILVTL